MGGYSAFGEPEGPGGGGVDTTAIHKATAAEISALTEKTAPTIDDWLLAEDAAAADAKVKIKIGNIPRSFTETFFVSAAAAVDTTDFYGPNPTSTTAGYPAQLVWATSWGSGATPTAQTNYIGPIVPFNCNLIRMQLWVAPTGGALVEAYTIWKIPYTDGAAVGTMVQVGTTQTTASPSAGTANNYSQSISSGNAFNAGDAFILLRKNTSGATAATLRGTFVFQETL